MRYPVSDPIPSDQISDSKSDQKRSRNSELRLQIGGIARLSREAEVAARGDDDYSGSDRVGDRREPRSAISACNCLRGCRIHVLFSPPARLLRQDARFARLCMTLHLGEYWVKSGRWPDCVVQPTPHCDLMATCAAACETRAA
jgi:hypothetical protein